MYPSVSANLLTICAGQTLNQAAPGRNMPVYDFLEIVNKVV